MSSTSNKPWLIPGLSRWQAANFIGDILYTRVHARFSDRAGPITGMILEARSIQEIDALLDDPPRLDALIDEAHGVLLKHLASKGSSS